MTKPLISVLVFAFSCLTLYGQNLSPYSPKNSAVTDDSLVVFLWNPAPDASWYHLQVATDQDFTQIVIDSSYLILPNFSSHFPITGKYFWRIRGFNDPAFTDWSNSYTFTLFAPAAITGCRLWLKADWISGSQGSKINTWIDRSGWSNHASQNLAANQPVLHTNMLGGKHTLYFDGINDVMISPLLGSFNLFDIFLVNTLGQNFGSFYHGNPGANGYGFYRVNLGKYGILHGGSGTISFGDTLSKGFQVLQYARSSTARYYVNGNPSGNPYAGSPSLPAGNTYIGGIYSTNQSFQGYLAEVIVYNHELTPDDRKLVSDYLMMTYGGMVDLGPDILQEYSLCPVILDAGTGYTSYLWSTGESSQTINAGDGTFWVQTTNRFGLITRDTIHITMPALQPIHGDTAICAGDTITVKHAITGAYTVQWSNGSTLDSIRIWNPGNYFLQVTDSTACFQLSPHFQIVVDTFSQSYSIGNDTNLCSGQLISFLIPENDTLIYLWSDGTTQPSLQVFASGEYSVTITNPRGCELSDTISINIVGSAPTIDFSVIGNCINDSVLVEAILMTPDSIVEYYWDWGDNSANSTGKTGSHVYHTSGQYTITLSALSLSGCNSKTSKSITVNSLPIVLLELDSACHNFPVDFSDKVITVSPDSIISWFWDFGDGTSSDLQYPTHQYLSPGAYLVSVTIKSVFYCQSTDNDTVLVLSDPALPTPAIISSPFNNLIITDSLTISWINEATNIKNLIQISNDESFDTIIICLNAGLEINHCTVSNLNAGNYFLRILSFNICSDSVSSDIIPFKKLDIVDELQPAAWYQSSHQVLSDSTQVYELTDLSGNELHVNNANTAQQPVLLQNRLNCYPSVFFNGINTLLSTSYSASNQFFNLFTLSTIGRQSGPAFIGNPGSNGFGFYRQDTNFYGGFYGGIATFTFGPVTRKGYQIMEFLKSSSSTSFYSNHNKSGPSFGSSFNPPTPKLYIGGINPSQCFKGEFLELLYFDRELTEEERNTVFTYLHHKYAPPPVELGKDRISNYSLCPVLFSVDTIYSHYQWSNGDTTHSTLYHQTGWVKVTVTDLFEVSSSDSVFLEYPRKIPADTLICAGDTISLSAWLKPAYQYQWGSQDQGLLSADSAIRVFLQDHYWVRVSDSLGCFQSDTAIIQLDSFPQLASLGPDTALRCAGEYMALANGAAEAVQYLWHDGSTLAEMPVQAPGTYSVTVHNALGCRAVDSMWVALKGILPLAEFNLTDSVCLGESMQFFDLSQPDPQDTSATIIIWYWDFGDGNTSDQQHPLHLFQSPGNHLVKLRVETDAGCSRETEKTVFVYPLPRAAFLTASGCTGIAVPFTDHSYYPIDEGVAWEWNFGDPASGNLNFSSLKSPLHSYLNPGTYQVRLIVTTAAGCHDTVQQEVEIFEAPEADFTFTQACEGQPIQFTDISPLPPWHPVLGWEWDFGDGSPVSSQQHPVHTYAQWGSYPVTMTMKTFRCTVKKVMPVNTDPRPLAAFQATDWCVSTPYHFTDQSSISLGSITQWQWDFGVLGTDSLQHPVLVFPASGHYPLSLTVVSDKGCHSDPLGYEIEVFAPPLAAIEAFVNEWNTQYHVTFSSQSSQDVIIWQWHFGDGSTSPLENPFHAYADSGLYQVMLIVSNVHGCSDTAQLTLHLLSPRSDLVLSGIVHESTGGQFRFAADLYNAGTRYIGEVALRVSINGVPSLAENWTGSMPPDSGFRYLFKGGIPLRPGWSPYYYCITAENTDGLPDGDPGNNLQCEAINTVFTFPDPYPNPAFDLLYIDLVLEDEADVVFSVINALGQLLLSPSRHHGEKGLNRFSLPVESLPSGMYSLRVMIGGHHYLKRFTRL